MRTALASAAARAAARLSRRLAGGGATSLPGVVGLRLAPRLIETLSRDLAGSIIVTGTNGKTTTARFIGSQLAATGHPYLHNQAGSNLLRGIASSLALAKPEQRLDRWGLFEVDEATMPDACAALQPTVVVVTNLFRDQLDRYGELKRTADYIRQGLATLPASSTVLLNADDPLVASLGQGLPQTVKYFGIEDTNVSRGQLPHAADSLTSPTDGSLLEYDAVFVGHLGHYRSLSGDFKRPQPEIALAKVDLHGIEGGSYQVTAGRRKLQIDSRLPGLYNAYNALAAAAAGLTIKAPPALIEEAISSTAAAFGRVEEVSVGKQKVWLGLIKNPTGANEVIATLALDQQPKHLLILINDNFADGRDVSWLWDADFEELLPSLKSVVVGGQRGADMAVRLKYAGLKPQEIDCHEDIDAALQAALANTPKTGRLFVLPTYTALIELRKVLAKAGHVDHYLDQ